MSSFQAHVAKLARAAETVSTGAEQGPPAVAIPLSEAAHSLPPHIIAATDPVKLNKQAPIFRCPAWAGLPSQPFHLYCLRGKVPYPALGLQRFPYYLFGKNSVCDYVLEHPSISSMHAALIFNKEHACFVLLDLGSTNGVRLEGKRVEPRKPIPIAVGSVMQFGYSTRTYELRVGAPPPLKRLREDGDEGSGTLRHASSSALTGSAHCGVDEASLSAAVVGTAICPTTALSTAVASATGTTAAVSPAPERQVAGEPATPAATVEAAASKDHSALPVAIGRTIEPAAMTLAQATVSAAGASLTEGVAASASTEYAPIHLFQLVIKHKDVENPVSRGRNKGEIITRSRADALDMARYILAEHQQRVPVSPALGFSPWTADEFVATVGEYCEVSAKKKRGDLGMVEKGAFADEIDKAAFRLRCGEVSAPVETQLGVHLLYRCD
ncbi:FHA domain/PPIC-type PPIASE domain containing protein, putative [Leishmania lindenbergi]|uniref:FHA domain/PPIC-type PPIASE domain containing protein n=1 Tax=Leishmania lindenbergi TaxID=651832 RepID=A0AAW3ADK5_9TRYP